MPFHWPAHKTEPKPIRRCHECRMDRTDVLWDAERDRLLCTCCWLRLPQIGGRNRTMKKGTS